MKCDVVHNQLLSANDPATPPAPVEYHLAVCPACRKFQHQLVVMEKHVRLMPAPATGPERLLKRLARKRVTTVFSNGELTHGPSLTDRIKSHPILTGALAAGVAIVLGCFLYVRSQDDGTANLTVHRPPAPEPLVANLVECDVLMAQARTVSDKVQIFAKEAALFHVGAQESGRRLDEPDVRIFANVNNLSEQYCQVIEEGLIKRASDVPRRERRQLLKPIAEQLAQAGDEAQALASQRPPLRAALEKMAAAARHGDQRLRRLLAEEKQ